MTKIYKIYLKTDDNGLTNETDYSNISRYDAIADFCNDNDCTPDDILVIEIEDEAYAEIICEHNYEGNPRRYYNETINSAKSKYCEETGYDVDDVICLTKD